MSIDTLKLQTVKTYAQHRKAGQVAELLKFFTADGEVVDLEGKSHKGCQQLKTYYEQPSPDITSVADPVLLSDGRAMFEFTVKKYLMNWSIKAYFTFDTSLQITRITLHR